MKTVSRAEGKGEMDANAVVTVSALRCRIERIVTKNWRVTRSAKFQTPDGYFLCEVWFEQGKPCFQFRSNAEPVPRMENAIETTAIQMAAVWAAEEMRRG